MANKSEKWNLSQGLLNFLASILISVTLTIIGIDISSSIREKDIQIQYVQLAVGILRKPPDKNSNTSLREWAVNVLNKYSMVPIPNNLQQDLLENQLSDMSTENSNSGLETLEKFLEKQNKGMAITPDPSRKYK